VRFTGRPAGIQHHLDRITLDEFSARSHACAAAAASRAFDDEIVPITVEGPDGTARTVTTDETVRPSITVEALAEPKPAFYDPELEPRFSEIDWMISAGNSSPLTHGASAALIMNEGRATALGLRPQVVTRPRPLGPCLPSPHHGRDRGHLDQRTGHPEAGHQCARDQRRRRGGAE
jgi:acetyl-CoA acetyltransferase